jgi:hypothetical protein
MNLIYLIIKHRNQNDLVDFFQIFCSPYNSFKTKNNKKKVI